MMGERTWQNPYYIDGNSLPSSRKLTSLRAGEFNRQRWGSVWGQDASKDLPPPSWLERGLSRLDHNSQLLVISHDSASSPDSSTTGSTGSDTNKTYLRGQNLPVDTDILQEREIKRQKAIELQTAIKQQLVERENKRKEEREKKLKEERAEEERIMRERDLEKKRFEEEQRHQREKEEAKLKKTKVIQEVLASAERKAKEEKQQRHRLHSNLDHRDSYVNSEDHNNSLVSPQHVETPRIMNNETKQTVNQGECSETTETRDTRNSTSTSDAVRLPISQEVTILLSGRIEDPELLSKSSLKLVNLVVSPRSTGRLEAKARGELGGINLSALLSGLSSPVILQAATASRQASPCVFENRLLTPSKYRVSSGRDFGTQTDCEGEVSADAVEKTQSMMTKEVKERKEAVNSNRREFDKSTNTGQVEESSIKSLNRNKTQARMSIESRPRWNANRPGTRYRTQSEKDPHYQRRMRLRRRQVETSDEGSSDFRRSPSPSRRKYGITKAKLRSSLRRKVNVENYDADLSMDSLNSLVPLHTDQNGRINIERCDETLIEGGNNSDSNIWCRDDILSHFTSLRNNVVMKKKEWDLEECPITPITELC